MTIILPKKLDSAEDYRQHYTQPVSSKLFGNIFFNEQILPLEFYQQSAKGRKQITAEIPEILDLVEELNFHSEQFGRTLRKRCKVIPSFHGKRWCQNPETVIRMSGAKSGRHSHCQQKNNIYFPPFSPSLRSPSVQILNN